MYEEEHKPDVKKIKTINFFLLIVTLFAVPITFVFWLVSELFEFVKNKLDNYVYDRKR